MTKKELIPCVGCGALVPDTDGPTHAYIGASPGCWAIYGEVLVKEFGEYRNPPVHRLTVDTYAVQHPGLPSRRSIQSVAVHLISLYLVLERRFNYKTATAAMQKVSKHRDLFTWLDPPYPLTTYRLKTYSPRQTCYNFFRDIIHCRWWI